MLIAWVSLRLLGCWGTSQCCQSDSCCHQCSWKKRPFWRNLRRLVICQEGKFTYTCRFAYIVFSWAINPGVSLVFNHLVFAATSGELVTYPSFSSWRTPQDPTGIWTLLWKLLAQLPTCWSFLVTDTWITMPRPEGKIRFLLFVTRAARTTAGQRQGPTINTHLTPDPIAREKGDAWQLCCPKELHLISIYSTFYKVKVHSKCL